MKYTYPKECKTPDQKKQYRIEARKAKKAAYKEKLKSKPRAITKGNGWQRGYDINKYYGNTKAKLKTK